LKDIIIDSVGTTIEFIDKLIQDIFTPEKKE